MIKDLTSQRIVVIGNGMAGSRFIDDVLARQADGRAVSPVQLTLVGAEPYGAYNRVLLSEVLAGRADVAALSLSDPAHHASRGVDVRLGVHALAVDRAQRKVQLDDGASVGYDRLLIATGAAPVIPTLDGLGGPTPPIGVHTFRTVDDCREIVAGTANAQRAVVLGGGLLGLETARGLARRGLDVTVVQNGSHLLARQLDAAAGAVLARTLRGLGVRVRTGAETTGITSRNGQLRSVLLADGEELPADLLVISCGVQARTGLAQRAGLAVRRGIVIDDTLTTSDPAVLAIGDCAEHLGELPGLVAPAWEQARVAADRLTGAAPAAVYRASRPAVRLKAADVEVAAAGETQVDPWADEPGLEVVQLLDPGRGRYIKAVVRGGVVVGVVAIGDPRAAAELSLLVERGSPAPADRAQLLMPGSRQFGGRVDDPTLIPDRATVCRCNGVTKGAIVRAWRGGARTVPAISDRTRACTGCGTCRDAVSGILGWLAAADPDPDDSLPQLCPPTPVSSGGS